MAVRPCLHAIWREKCAEAGILAKECWITGGGEAILEVTREVDMRAKIAGSTSFHQYETFDYVGMYPNIPVAPLKKKMKGALKLAFAHQEKLLKFKSLFIRWDLKGDVTPVVREIYWTEEEPRVVAEDIEGEYFVGYERVCTWINFILDEGFTQFGKCMHQQSSGIFMGMSPALDLANIFAFMHELDFLGEMIDEHLASRAAKSEPLYPFQFIEQYAVATKRYIDDIFTAAYGVRQGPTMVDVLYKEGGIYGGMYPAQVKNAEGKRLVALYVLPENSVVSRLRS